MSKQAWHVAVLGALILLTLGETVAAGVVVEGALTNERQAQPGETYRGTILIRNTDDSPSEVKVYQTDYDFSADGGINYGTPGGLARSNAKWVSLSREAIVIQPKSAETVEFEVRVPAGGNLSGTYWSVVLVEPIPKDSAETGADGARPTATLTQTIRYAIQVVTHIGSGGAGELSFSNPQLLTEEGKRRFTIDVANTGQRWVRPNLWLELYSESGSPVGKFSGGSARLYPDTSARVRFDLGDPPKGKYLGMVAADGTGDNLFGANVELEVK